MQIDLIVDLIELSLRDESENLRLEDVDPGKNIGFRTKATARPYPFKVSEAPLMVDADWRMAIRGLLRVQYESCQRLPLLMKRYRLCQRELHHYVTVDHKKGPLVEESFVGFEPTGGSQYTGLV
jgi:hypothetical protein